MRRDKVVATRVESNGDLRLYILDFMSEETMLFMITHEEWLRVRDRIDRQYNAWHAGASKELTREEKRKGEE